MVISKSFARCIAKISGDGNLSTGYVRYNNKCPDLLKEFKRDMLKEFGKNIHFTEGTSNSGTNFIKVTRKFVAESFLKQLKDFKSFSIYIPNSIKKSKLSIKKEYLRALYDDEGSAVLRLYKKTKEWKRSITLCSNSIRLLNEIKFLLLKEFDITSNKIIRNKISNPKDQCYVLCITGEGNILKFKKSIGFLHPRKIRRLNLILRSYKATSRNKVEFEKLKRELLTPSLKKGGQLSMIPL